MGPGGWRRSKRDLMIDEAVKAAMLAYACQFRLDDEMTSSSADAALRKAVDGKKLPRCARPYRYRCVEACAIAYLAAGAAAVVSHRLRVVPIWCHGTAAGALAEGGSRSGADAAEDAAFALETASRHLEWFVKRCRDLVRTVEKASTNPLLSGDPQVKQQKRIATDLIMGLAESLGWFGLLIDTVTHVSQGRRSSMREDNLVYQSSGIGSGTDPGSSTDPSLHQAARVAHRTAPQRRYSQCRTHLTCLPSRQAPPGAFPGTSESYMHDDLKTMGRSRWIRRCRGGSWSGLRARVISSLRYCAIRVRWLTRCPSTC